MNAHKDAHHRSILKAISWRFVATTTTVLIVFAFTRKFNFSERFSLSVGVGIADVILKLFLYYLHERIWGSVDFGRKKLKELDYISEE